MRIWHRLKRVGLRLHRRVFDAKPRSMWVNPATFDLDDEGPFEYVRFVAAPHDDDEVQW